MKLSFAEQSNDRTLPADYTGPVLLWDIDKTYLDTHFSSWRGLFSIPFEMAVDKQPIPGAVALLRALRRGTATELSPLYFVSGSPPQLRRVIEHRMTLDGVQYDGITFKDQWGLVRAGRRHDVKRQLGYKLKALLAYRAALPNGAKWWLFGDDVEADAETFRLFGRVCAGLRGEELDTRLSDAEVHRQDKIEIHALLHDLPVGEDPVEAIVIRCTRGVLPEYTEDRIYPCLSFLQAALLAFDRGLIKQDDVWPVLRDVRRRGLSNAETANHRDDAVKRFGLNLEGLEAWP